jgi:hypothetical protein
MNARLCHLQLASAEGNVNYEEKTKTRKINPHINIMSHQLLIAFPNLESPIQNRTFQKAVNGGTKYLEFEPECKAVQWRIPCVLVPLFYFTHRTIEL